MIELVEEEISELLPSYTFPGAKTPLIPGSAFSAVDGGDSSTGPPSLLSFLPFFASFLLAAKYVVILYKNAECLSN